MTAPSKEAMENGEAVVRDWQLDRGDPRPIESLKNLIALALDAARAEAVEECAAHGCMWCGERTKRARQPGKEEK